MLFIVRCIQRRVQQHKIIAAPSSNSLGYGQKTLMRFHPLVIQMLYCTFPAGVGRNRTPEWYKGWIYLHRGSWPSLSPQIVVFPLWGKYELLFSLTGCLPQSQTSNDDTA